MKLFVRWRLKPRNELFLSHYGFQRMTIVKFDQVICRISGALILAFQDEIFALLDADISHSLLSLHPLVALDLCFETLDIPLSLPILGFFVDDLDRVSSRRLTRFYGGLDKSTTWRRCYETGCFLWSFSHRTNFLNLCFRSLRFHSRKVALSRLSYGF